MKNKTETEVKEEESSYNDNFMQPIKGQVIGAEFTKMGDIILKVVALEDVDVRKWIYKQIKINEVLP